MQLVAISRPSATRAIGRGLLRRCPRCGKGRLFEGWYRLLASCEHCGLRFSDSTSDHIALIYLSTAVQTAGFAFLILMVRPASPWLARGALALIALAIMLANLPNRKGFAIAVDYLVERPPESAPSP